MLDSVLNTLFHDHALTASGWLSLGLLLVILEILAPGCRSRCGAGG